MVHNTLKIPRAHYYAITAFVVFFSVGSLLSFLAGISLVMPSALFETIWRFNPRGHAGLLRVGFWGTALLFSVSLACAAAASGLWQRARWGHTIATTLIAINLLGNIVNVVLGTEPRAIIGVPIALAMLLYLRSKSVRNCFRNKVTVGTPSRP